LNRVKQGVQKGRNRLDGNHDSQPDPPGFRVFDAQQHERDGDFDERDRPTPQFQTGPYQFPRKRVWMREEFVTAEAIARRRNQEAPFPD
jgi:hypothetical protein